MPEPDLRRKEGAEPLARRLLRENRTKLDAIVTQLLAHESLDESEVYAAAGIPRPAAAPAPLPA